MPKPDHKAFKTMRLKNTKILIIPDGKRLIFSINNRDYALLSSTAKALAKYILEVCK